MPKLVIEDLTRFQVLGIISIILIAVATYQLHAKISLFSIAFAAFAYPVSAYLGSKVVKQTIHEAKAHFIGRRLLFVQAVRSDNRQAKRRLDRELKKMEKKDN